MCVRAYVCVCVSARVHVCVHVCAFVYVCVCSLYTAVVIKQLEPNLV